MSLSSDTFLTTSSSSGSASSSVENISTTVERRELSVFTFISPKHQSVTTTTSPAPFQHSANQYLGSSEFGLDASYSPSPQPTSCSCVNNDIGTYLRSNVMTSSPTTYLIDPYRFHDPENLHWKYHHQYGRKLIGSPEGTRCNCHVHHYPQMDHVFSDNNYRRLLHHRNGDGLLLRSLEKGVLFPVIHWSTLYNNENSTHPNTQQYPALLLNQGIYKELKSVIPADICLRRDAETFVRLRTSSPTGSNSSLSQVPSRKPTTWLIIGYKSLEKTLDSTLEASWKEWTGIRHVYLHLRSDFEIRKISFLHRIHPIDNLDLFMYVVTMEIGNVDERNRIWLLDFVQRMRVERMKGFLTVYSEVEPEISSIGDEFRKYSSDTEDHTHPIQPPPVPRRSNLQRTPSPVLTPHSQLNGTLSSSLLDHHTSEINGNIKFMEKLLEEINMQPIGDYF